MVEKLLECWIGIPAIVVVPIADRDQEWARQGELGDTLGMRCQKSSVVDKNRLVSRHWPYYDFRVLHFTLMREAPAAFESTHAAEELTNVLSPAPFAIADDIEACLLLAADGEGDEIIQRTLESFW